MKTMVSIHSSETLEQAAVRMRLYDTISNQILFVQYFKLKFTIRIHLKNEERIKQWKSGKIVRIVLIIVRFLLFPG